LPSLAAEQWIASDTYRGIHASAPADGGLIYAGLSGRLLFVGPYAPEGATGCGECAARWRTDVVGSQQGAYSKTLELNGILGPLATFVLSDAVDAPGSYRGRLLAIDLTSGEMRWHSVRPHPFCGICRIRPGDHPVDLLSELAMSRGTSLPGLRSGAFDRDALKQDFVDFRFGIVAHLSRDESSPLSLTMAETVRPDSPHLDRGFGRGTSFDRSEVPAILEGLERIQSARPLGTITSVSASAKALGGSAIDPVELGLHEEQNYRHPESNFEAFTRDLVTDWVWAWSTLEQRSVLVPEHVAYWGAHGAGAQFLYESSNGCAVGSSLQEAVLYGLFEVIERDAFLLAWYSRTRVGALPIGTEPADLMLVDSLAERGMHLHILDITSEFDVSVAMAVITADENEVEAGRARALNLAAGAHPFREKAVSSAIAEAATNALMFPQWAKQDPARYAHDRHRPMLDDFSLVKSLDDHTGMFGLNEARQLWEFLGEGGAVTDASEPPAMDGTADLGEVLSSLLSRFHSRGMDVIIVDQTAPLLLGSSGVRAVKVIVPGMLPMTFGHLNRRTAGLSRLGSAGSLLVSAQASSPPLDSVPDVPHPFP
jgi:ribosomal protein S12 methylthiotransferase accessory factor